MTTPLTPTLSREGRGGKRKTGLTGGLVLDVFSPSLRAAARRAQKTLKHGADVTGLFFNKPLIKEQTFLSSYIVAITGASGAVYGIRLIEELLKRGGALDLIVSPTGFILLKDELGLDASKETEKAIRAFILKRKKGKAPALKGSLRYTPAGDLTAKFASGSALRKKMIICPCSMGTLGRIASGVSGNLIERAADCVLKERGELVLVPRETPLNAIHLENMLRLSRAGAVILPAMPGFYSRPRTIDDMVDFVVGKALDILGIENSLYKRWR